ncbi:GntR family transcriptional regulator [Tabrizicola sp.]|uniref:GntR family transcriptional regulator n=1 Tax=Tabrizicola sp. TaxID=2005166 RepID=UPI0035B3351E
MTDVRRIERVAAPLRKQVVRALREDILNGQLAPGQRLIEASLCATYGVSRTVIREALRQLESESLIRVIPAQGPAVAVLTEAEIRALYVVRATLEGLAGRLFVESADDAAVARMISLLHELDERYLHGTLATREDFKARFYATLLEGAGNMVLTDALSRVHARVTIFQRIAFVDEGRVRLSSEELRKIIDSCAVRRDAAAAQAACENHIRVAAELALLEYERRAPGFRLAQQKPIAAARSTLP